MKLVRKPGGVSKTHLTKIWQKPFCFCGTGSRLITIRGISQKTLGMCLCVFFVSQFMSECVFVPKRK